MIPGHLPCWHLALWVVTVWVPVELPKVKSEVLFNTSSAVMGELRQWQPLEGSS